MSLQDEIKQSKPFERPGTEALLSIVRTSALLEHALGKALKPFGVTHTQYNALRILRGAGAPGLCGREVGERLLSPVPDVSRLLDRLTEMGLAARRPDPEDRRQVRATITDAGLELLERATPSLEEEQARWIDGVDEARLRALTATLARIRAAADGG